MLQTDEEKRKVYDETGGISGYGLSKDFDEWYDFYRKLFPPITTRDIDEFSDKYKGKYL